MTHKSKKFHSVEFIHTWDCFLLLDEATKCNFSQRNDAFLSNVTAIVTAPKFVTMTTSRGINDECFVKMTAFQLHCIIINELRIGAWNVGILQLEHNK